MRPVLKRCAIDSHNLVANIQRSHFALISTWKQYPIRIQACLLADLFWGVKSNVMTQKKNARHVEGCCEKRTLEEDTACQALLSNNNNSKQLWPQQEFSPFPEGIRYAPFLLSRHFLSQGPFFSDSVEDHHCFRKHIIVSFCCIKEKWQRSSRLALEKWECPTQALSYVNVHYYFLSPLRIRSVSPRWRYPSHVNHRRADTSRR